MIPLATASAQEAPAPVDFRSYLDQAKFYAKREWYDDAREQLELAVATDDGRLDPEAWALLAKVCYELRDLGRARFAADRALVQSRTDDQAAQARELLAFFDAQFGLVTVEGARPGQRVRLRVALESVQLDPELKDWIREVADAAQRGVTLPYVLGLPAGAYTVNGAPVEVVAGEKAAVAPRLGGPTVSGTRVELGAGGGLLAGDRADGQRPGPLGELALTVPVGRLELGAGALLGARPFETPDGNRVAWSDAALLARVGVVAHAGPLAFRPALEARAGAVPGFGLACADRGRAFACAVDPPARQLFVGVPATGIGGGAALLALVEPPGARIGVGLGVAADALAATLAADGEAVGDAGTFPFRVPDPDRRFGVVSARAGLVTRIGF